MRRLKLIFVSAVTSALLLSCSQPSIEPTELRCEYAENPLIDIQNPRLSWINSNEAEIQGAAQSAYQIQVALGCDDFKNLVWDSGKVSSDAEVVGTAKKRDIWYRPENVDVINSSISGLVDMASSYGVGLSALVLAWQMSYTDNMCVCVGARKEFQIEENAKAIGLKISESDLKTIGDILLSIEPASK